MKPKLKPLKPALMLMLPLLLIAGCGTRSVLIKPSTQSLPAQAKVSQVPTPSECLPTCSAGWAKLVNESADTLTK